MDIIELSVIEFKFIEITSSEGLGILTFLYR